jgi:hypothetical protein
MGSLAGRSAAIAVLAVLLVAPARAGEPPRSGFVLEAGSGPIVLFIPSKSVNPATVGGRFAVRVGGMVSQSVAILVATDLDFVDEAGFAGDEGVLTVGHAGTLRIEAKWLSPSRFWVRAGIGGGYYIPLEQVSDPKGGAGVSVATSGGVDVWRSWQHRVVLAIELAATYMRTTSEDRRDLITLSLGLSIGRF